MANNYTLFSIMIPYANDEQRDWLMAELGRENETDWSDVGNFEDEPKEHGIWVYSEEGGDTDRLVDVVCQFQSKFGLKDPWICEFAFTCNKPRIGEFGGAAVLCLKGEQHWFNPGNEAMELAKKLQAEEAISP